MNSKIKDALTSRIIVNAFNKKYPSRPPTTNSLSLHLEIYELINEYVSLMTDMEKATGSTISLIRPRLKEIEDTLLDYWIVKDKDMIRQD